MSGSSSPLRKATNIALCCSFISFLTVSSYFSVPTCSAYEVFSVLTMRPPSMKRCVMTCGCRTPESSVWT